MTIQEALTEARETGKIAVTKETLNMLQAVENLCKAQEGIIMAIDENCPDEMGDATTINSLENGIYEGIAQTYDGVFAAVGEIILRGMFLCQQRDDFKGI